MSEDYVVGDASGLGPDPADADGPGVPRFLGDEGDGDDLPSSCACGQAKTCFFLDPADCAKAKAMKAQPPTPVLLDFRDPIPPAKGVGGVWVTCRPDYDSGGNSYYDVTVHQGELEALRAVNGTDMGLRARFIEWGETL